MSKLTSQKEWSVYLLISQRGHTYVGCSTDVYRRLRQHNKEIRGGARATSKEGNWGLLASVKGFQGRAEAMRWEALVKKRARGKKGRLHALFGLILGECPQPKHKKAREYKVPSGLIWQVHI